MSDNDYPAVGPRDRTISAIAARAAERAYYAAGDAVSDGRYEDARNAALGAREAAKHAKRAAEAAAGTPDADREAGNARNAAHYAEAVERYIN